MKKKKLGLGTLLLAILLMFSWMSPLAWAKEDQTSLSVRPMAEVYNDFDVHLTPNKKQLALGEVIEVRIDFVNMGDGQLSNLKATCPLFEKEVTFDVDTVPSWNVAKGYGTFTVTEDMLHGEPLKVEVKVEATTTTGRVISHLFSVNLAPPPVEEAFNDYELILECDRKEAALGDKIKLSASILNMGEEDLSDFRLTSPAFTEELSLKGPISPWGSEELSIDVEILESLVQEGKIVIPVVSKGVTPTGKIIERKSTLELALAKAQTDCTVKLLLDSTEMELGKELTGQIIVKNVGQSPVGSLSLELDGLMVDGLEPMTEELAPGEETIAYISMVVDEAMMAKNEIILQAKASVKDEGDQAFIFVSEKVTLKAKKIETPPAKLRLNGAANITNLVLGDEITTSFELSVEGSAVTDLTYDLDGKKLTGLQGTIQPGETITLEDLQKVDQALVDYGQLKKTLTVTGKDANGLEVKEVHTVTVTGQQLPKLSLKRTVDKLTYKAGDVIHSDILVENIGNVTIHHITMEDTNLGVFFQDLVPTSLAPGEKTTFSYDYAVSSVNLEEGVIFSTATATGETKGLFPKETFNAANMIIFEMASHPDDGAVAMVMLSTDAQNFRLGEEITYHYLIQNIGDVPFEIAELNSNLLGPIAVNPTELMPAMAAQGDLTVKVRPDMLKDEKLYHKIDLVAVAEHGRLMEESDAVTLDPSDAPLLLADLTTNKASYGPGETIHYRLKLTNPGKVALEQLTLTCSQLGLNELDLKVGLSPGEERVFEFSQEVSEELLKAKSLAVLMDISAKSGGETIHRQGNVTVTFVDQATNIHDLTVKTRDYDSLLPIQGATYELRQKGQRIAIGIDQGERGVRFEHLNPGTYDLVQTTTPQGYFQAEDLTVEISPDQISYEVLVENYPEEAEEQEDNHSINVHKIDQTTKENLAGAEFELWQGTTLLDTKVTDEAGHCRFENLPTGNFILRETKAPTGYQLLIKDYPVEMADHLEEFTLTVENIKSTTGEEVIEPELNHRLTIRKIDDKTREVLSGAEFTLEQNGQILATGITDQAGEIHFKDLPSGKYILKETKAPEGYTLKIEDYEVEFTAENQDKELIIHNSKTKVEEDEITPVIHRNLNLLKVDGQSLDVLAGASFELYQGGNLIGQGVSDVEGRLSFKDLKAGHYVLREVNAPKGYQKIQEDISLEIGENTTDYNLRIRNHKSKDVDEDWTPNANHRLILDKVDKDSQAPLANATFELWQGSKKIGQTTTNDQGQGIFEPLAEGDYELKEVQAPEGYQIISEAMKVTIEPQTQDYRLRIHNQKIKSGGGEVNPPISHRLVIKKVDETGKPLANAHFELRQQGIFVGQKSSDEEGQAIFENLPGGSFELKEVQAPEGYQRIEEPMTFEIAEDVTDYTFTVTNHKVKEEGNPEPEAGIIRIKKVAQDRLIPLAGATFELKGEDGKILKATTSEKGLCAFQSLPLGNYELKEVTAPKGYLLNREVIKVQVTSQEPVSLTISNQKELEPEPEKQFSQLEILLSGKKHKGTFEPYSFVVWDAAGKVLDRITTDAKGRALLRDCTPGVVTVIPMEAELWPKERQVLLFPSEKTTVTFKVEKSKEKKKNPKGNGSKEKENKEKGNKEKCPKQKGPKEKCPRGIAKKCGKGYVRADWAL